MTEDVKMISEDVVQAMIADGIAKALSSEREKAKAEREHFIKQRNEKKHDYNELMKNSDEPWINIESGNELTENGIAIELEWNDALVRYLKANGVPGITEDEIVQTWLNGVYHSMGPDPDEKKDKGDFS